MLVFVCVSCLVLEGFLSLNKSPMTSFRVLQRSTKISSKGCLSARSVSQWLIGGLGPGGLDVWDPFMKGIELLRGSPLRSPNYRDPNHFLETIGDLHQTHQRVPGTWIFQFGCLNGWYTGCRKTRNPLSNSTRTGRCWYKYITMSSVATKTKLIFMKKTYIYIYIIAWSSKHGKLRTSTTC